MKYYDKALKFYEVTSGKQSSGYAIVCASKGLCLKQIFGKREEGQILLNQAL